MPRLKATAGEIERYLSQLAETPVTIRSMAAGLNAEECQWSPTPKDWSVVAILTHVRSCADVWSYSIYAMLTENQPALPLIDERRWAKNLDYATLSFEVSMGGFARQREDLLRRLRALKAEQWERTGQIEGRSHSVFSQTRRMALHEAEHFPQIQTLIDQLKTQNK